MSTEASGIYQIRNVINGNRYVGSAVRFSARWASHRSRLNKGRHHSNHLQNAWNKYGEECFEFSILEICAKESLIEREQAHIDLGCEYNKAPKAGSPLGVKWSQEARDRASKRRSGVPKSINHVQKMSGLTSQAWKDQSTRKKMIEGIKKSYSPSLKKERSIKQKQNWDDPIVSDKIKKGIKNSYTDELRALRSAQSKARWANPEFRARMVDIRRKRAA